MKIKNQKSSAHLLRFMLIMVSALLLLPIKTKALDNDKMLIGFSDASLEQAFKKVEGLYKVRFTYSPIITRTPKKISLEEKVRTLQEVLDQMSLLADLKFMKVGNLIGVQKFLSVETLPKEITLNSNVANAPIKGKVTDADNNPVEGVSINIKGSKLKGTVTNKDGEFSIDAQKGDILLISSIGFETQEMEVQNSNSIALVLRASEKKLEEVVVTALGIRKEKAKISYATQEVKGTSLDKAPQPNVAENLVGKVAGLNIIPKTNLFENPEIYLRGAKTLVVIDGVPTDNNTFDFWNLNPNDIDNVTVLKGTAAGALYGSLGINGAIMITTKRGKAGAQGPEIVYNSTTQFQAGYLRIPKTQDQYGMGWSGYYAFVNGKGGGGWYDDYGYVWGPKLNVKNSSTPSGFDEYPQYNSPYNADSLYTFTQAGFTDQSHYKPLPAITRGSNNLKNFLNNEFITTQNFSIAGKNENADYRISVTHLYQKGQVPNTKLNSTTLNLSGSVKVTSKLKLESILSYNKQYTPNYPQTGYGANNFFYNILLWMGPDVDIRDLRNYWQPAGGRTTGNGFLSYGVPNVQQFNYNYTWYNNPWYVAHENLNGYTNDVITGQLSATYNISKDLIFFLRSGIITNNALSNLETPKSYIFYGSGEFDGNYSERRRNNFQIVTDALLTYNKSFFNNDFNATASVGASNRYNNNSYLYSKTNGLNVPVDYNLANTIGAVYTENFKAEKNVNSVFGYVDLDYKKMVFLGVTGRNDATTNLQKPYNSYFYPSASLGVIPTTIFKLPSIISYAKLRASYANVTTDNILLNGDDIFTNWYATLPVYQTGPRWNGTNASLSLPGTLIQPKIRPNKTISQEYGTELRFLQNRLGIDFTYFSYIDKDFAFPAPVSSASGFNYQLVNGDRINRKGIELVLTGTPVRTKNFKWDITANYSTVHSWYKELYGGDSIRNGVKVGERVDVFRGYDWERTPDGQIVYNANGLPQYINQVINIGHTDPDFIFGVINNLSYKNLSISFSFDGRIGGITENGLEQKLYEGGTHPATANSYRDDAYAGKKTYIGQGMIVTSGNVTYDVQGNVISDSRKFAPNTTPVNYIDWVFATYVNGIAGANIYKRSFVKLREVVLSYNFAPKVLKRTPFKGASFSVTGRNLLLFTKVPFMDPDSYTGYSLAEPTYRNVGVNINLKF